MAPKAAPAPPPPEVGPFVYVTYSVTSADRLLGTTENAAPVCSVQCSAPMAASAVSEPVALSDEGPHSISLELESKCPLADARQLLEKLINEPVRVTVLADGDAVATASLDLTPAATRGGGCIAERLQLQAMDRGDGGTATLIPTATVAVTVTLSQDAPQGGPDEGGQAPHEGETADNGQAGAEARVPFEFVKPSEAEETTVVTATAAMVGEPATLAAGATLAGGFTAQLALCWASAGVTCGVPVAFAAWTGGHLDWSEARAAVLHREHFLALRAAHVKRLPIFVELARYVKTHDTANDAAFHNYHACAWVDPAALERLQAPGATSFTCTLRFEDTFATFAAAAAASEAPVDCATALPSPATPGTKAKVVEAALKPGEGGVEACGWKGAEVTLTVSFTNPLVAAWKPPPKPAKTLRDLVPAPPPPPPPPPRTATVAFRDKIKVLALELADAYAEQGNGAGGDADAHSARHRRLVFELNRSGRYLDMRRRLQDCLKSVARETLHRAPGATPEEDGALFSALYAHALDEMHGALNALRADEAPPAADAPKGGAEVARLEQLAAECEVTGDTKRAEALHLERLAGSNCADVWHAYGTFSARTGNLGRAEEAFRSAVALEPSRTASLLALACVLWHNGVHTDSAFIEDAITVVDAASTQQSDPAVAWALRCMLYRASPNMPEQEIEVRNAAHHTQVLAERTRGDAAPSLQSQPFLQLEIQLLDLQLGDLAAAVHEHAAAYAGAEAVRVPLAMCEAQAAGLAGDMTRATDILTSAAQNAGPGSAERVNAHVLLGHLHAKAGSAVASLLAYEAALHASPQACPLDVYIRVGSAYLARGDYEHAVDVFGQACIARPCAAAWLGAGTAYIRLGQLEDADLALSEANSHDPRNATVWGHLALVHLLAQRAQESAQCLEHGYKCGLEDAALLQELALVHAKQGAYHEAVPVLRKAVAVATGGASFELLAALGEALLACNDLPAAQSQWRAAQAVAEGGRERAVAAAALESIGVRLGLAPGEEAVQPAVVMSGG